MVYSEEITHRRTARRGGALRRAGARAADPGRADRDVLAGPGAPQSLLLRELLPADEPARARHGALLRPQQLFDSSGWRTARSRVPSRIWAGCASATCGRCSRGSSIRRSAAGRLQRGARSRSATAPAPTPARCCWSPGSACCSAGGPLRSAQVVRRWPALRLRPRRCRRGPRRSRPAFLAPGRRRLRKKRDVRRSSSVTSSERALREPAARPWIRRCWNRRSSPAKPVKLDSPSDAELAVAALGPRGRDPLFARCLSYARQLCGRSSRRPPAAAADESRPRAVPSPRASGDRPARKRAS